MIDAKKQSHSVSSQFGHLLLMMCTKLGITGPALESFEAANRLLMATGDAWRIAAQPAQVRVLLQARRQVAHALNTLRIAVLGGGTTLHAFSKQYRPITTREIMSGPVVTTVRRVTSFLARVRPAMSAQPQVMTALMALEVAARDLELANNDRATAEARMKALRVDVMTAKARWNTCLRALHATIQAHDLLAGTTVAQLLFAETDELTLHPDAEPQPPPPTPRPSAPEDPKP